VVGVLDSKYYICTCMIIDDEGNLNC
jgi:hypothetical protein